MGVNGMTLHRRPCLRAPAHRTVETSLTALKLKDLLPTRPFRAQKRPAKAAVSSQCCFFAAAL
jgi:hypothetical protein